MARNSKKAVAYYRTSSAANVGPEKDSLRRQQEAVKAYAKALKIEVVAEFYDAAISGADAVQDRPGFAQLLERIAGNGVGAVLIEDASRFARDLAVQITGHDLLKRLGVDLVPVNAPDHFTDDTPTAVMVHNILGAVSQFEKANLVAKLKGARKRKREETGRCEGRKPVAAEVIAEAKRLARKSPKTGRCRPLREIAEELSKLGFKGPSGLPYYPESVKRMLAS